MSLAVLVQVPEQFVGVAPAQTQVPAAKQVPPTGVLHGCPLESGVALHVVPVPTHTIVPAC